MSFNHQLPNSTDEKMITKSEGNAIRAASDMALVLNAGERVPASERPGALDAPKAASPHRLWNRLAVRGRRGAISAVFAVGMTGFLGMVGLGTEVGSWYVGKRHGQNAVDAAAIAGVQMIASGRNSSAAIAAATDAATRNGFTIGGTVTVTVNNPPTSGTHSGQSNAVEVVLSQTPPALLASLFVANVSIVNRGVAAMNITGVGACVLGINYGGYQGDVSMAGSANLNMPNCEIAANGTDPTAMYDQGNGNQIAAYTLLTSGGCSGCSGSNVTLTRRFSEYQPPTPDPYAAVQTVTLPTFSGKACVSSPVPWSPTNPQAFCGNKWQVSSGQTVNLTPGTYFFYNASIDIQGGATVTCLTCSPGGAGVTFILTGSSASKVGSLSLAGNANALLNAPALGYAETHTYFGCSATSCPFGGILFYMDQQASPGTGGKPPVAVNGNSSTLTGGLYFPSVYVSYSGDMSGNGAGCTVLVANNITFTGGSSGMDVSQCLADGIPFPQPQVVASRRAEGLIEIVLPGGASVRVDAQVDGRALRRVLGALCER